MNTIFFTAKNKAEKIQQINDEDILSKDRVSKIVLGEEFKSTSIDDLESVLSSKNMIIKDCKDAEILLSFMIGFNTYGNILFSALGEEGEEFKQQLMESGLVPKNLFYVYDNDAGIQLPEMLQRMGGFAETNGGIENFLADMKSRYEDYLAQETKKEEEGEDGQA